MHEYASDTQEARELLSDLEYLWDQVKDIEPSTSPSTKSVEPLDNMSAAAITAAGLFGYNGSNAGSYTSFDPRLRRVRAGSTGSGAAPSQTLDALSYGLGPSTAGGGSFMGGVGGSGQRRGGGSRHAGGGASADRGRKAGSHPVDRDLMPGRASSGVPALFDESLDPDNQEMRKWSRDVTWALETINEEIMAMRHRYAAAAAGDGDGMEPAGLPYAGHSGASPLAAVIASEVARGRPGGPGVAHLSQQQQQPSVYSYDDNVGPAKRRGGDPHASYHHAYHHSHSHNHHNDLLSHSSQSDDSAQWIQALLNVVKYIFKRLVWRLLARFLWGVGKHVLTDLVVIKAFLMLMSYAKAQKAAAPRSDETTAVVADGLARVLVLWSDILNGLLGSMGLQLTVV